MKILNLSTVHRWNDPRIFYKEAHTLAKLHDLVHAAVGDFGEKTAEGVVVRPLGNWKSRLGRPKLWLRAYLEIIKSKADIIHFHDPELALLLLPVALLGIKKTVCDIHEHPSRVISGKAWIPKPFRKLIGAFFTRLLINTPYIYDHVILAEERYRPLFPSKSNITVILNHALIPNPDIPFYNRYEGFNPEENLNLLYVGSLTETRGATVMLKTARLLKEHFPNLTLHLVGKALPASLETILYKASRENAGTINYHGYIDHKKTTDLYRHAHIGLIPLQPHPNYLDSIATKFYDYMIHGLPCIASDFPLWKEFLDKNLCGISVDTTDPNRLSESIRKLASSPKTLTELSQNAYQRAREKYDWKSEGDKLLEIYKKLR